MLVVLVGTTPACLSFLGTIGRHLCIQLRDRRLLLVATESFCGFGGAKGYIQLRDRRLLLVATDSFCGLGGAKGKRGNAVVPMAMAEKINERKLNAPNGLSVVF